MNILRFHRLLMALMIAASVSSTCVHGEQPQVCDSAFNSRGDCDLAPAANQRLDCCCCFDWTGSYFGGRLGMNWLDPNPQPNLGLPAEVFVQPDSLGFLGGGYIGRNFQHGCRVFGIEGDFNGTSNDLTGPCLTPDMEANFSSDWNASLRGRFGIARNRVLIYGTGGYALSEFEGFTRIVSTGQIFGDSHTLSGYAVGGGVEYAWTNNILLRTEYIHEGFGSGAFQFEDVYLDQPQLDMLTFGSSLKF